MIDMMLSQFSLCAAEGCRWSLSSRTLLGCTPTPCQTGPRHEGRTIMGFSVDEDPLAVHRLHVRVVPQDEREVSTARVCGPGRDHPRVRVVLGSSSRRAVDAASRQHVLDGPSSAVCSQLRIGVRS